MCPDERESVLSEAWFYAVEGTRTKAEISVSEENAKTGLTKKQAYPKGNNQLELLP